MLRMMAGSPSNYFIDKMIKLTNLEDNQQIDEKWKLLHAAPLFEMHRSNTVNQYLYRLDWVDWVHTKYSSIVIRYIESQWAIDSAFSSTSRLALILPYISMISVTAKQRDTQIFNMEIRGHWYWIGLWNWQIWSLRISTGRKKSWNSASLSAVISISPCL